MLHILLRRIYILLLLDGILYKYQLNASGIVVVVRSLSCVQLCGPMDCSTPDFPALHHLPEFAQTHDHWVGDAIQPSCPLLPPSPVLSLSQDQRLFQWISSSYQVDKVLESNVPFKSCVSWLIFSLGALTIDESRVSKAPTITALLLIYPFMAVSICLIYCMLLWVQLQLQLLYLLFGLIALSLCSVSYKSLKSIQYLQYWIL